MWFFWIEKMLCNIDASPIYPCAYREHFLKIPFIEFVLGLSLCIQGTQPHSQHLSAQYRFIPVHTGNTKPYSMIPATSSVYPCAYREHWLMEQILFCRRGLSLCIQGTPASVQYFVSRWRFIPVHTGNTDEVGRKIHFLSVYPCAYREHAVHNLSLVFWIWFIPVHTGNTHPLLTSGNSETVYPCAYREHLHLSNASAYKHGLSLCIQGTHQL